MIRRLIGLLGVLLTVALVAGAGYVFLTSTVTGDYGTTTVAMLALLVAFTILLIGANVVRGSKATPYW